MLDIEHPPRESWDRSTLLLLLSHLRSLTALDNEILPLLDEEAIEAEIVETDEIKEQVYAALPKLEVALKPTTVERAPTHAAPATPEPTPKPPETPRTRPGTEGDDSAGEATSTTRGARVKLPKISLPHFSGDPVKWTSFWESYQSAIHGNDGLSDIDKFNYLRSLLDHTALDAIAGLTLSTTNYRRLSRSCVSDSATSRSSSRNSWTPS